MGLYPISVLYYKGPSYYHASYVVLVSENTYEPNNLDVQSNYRVSESTNKEIILANVTRPHGLGYSNPMDCITRLNEFKITEILPKRFLINQLTVAQKKSWESIATKYIHIDCDKIFNKVEWKPIRLTYAFSINWLNVTF